MTFLFSTSIKLSPTCSFLLLNIIFCRMRLQNLLIVVFTAATAILAEPVPDPVADAARRTTKKAKCGPTPVPPRLCHRENKHGCPCTFAGCVACPGFETHSNPLHYNQGTIEHVRNTGTCYNGVRIAHCDSSRRSRLLIGLEPGMLRVQLNCTLSRYQRQTQLNGSAAMLLDHWF